MKRLPSSLLVLLAPALALAAGGGAHGGHGDLHINWWQWDMGSPPVGWYIVDFVVFVGLLYYFLKKPLQRAFQSRHEAIKKTVADNEAAFARTKATYDESRGKLAAVERDVAQLISRIKEDGASERDRIISASQTYSARLLHDSKTIIAFEGAAARERLQRSVAEHALRLAEVALVKELGPADRERMIDDAISEIEKVESVASHKRRPQGVAETGGDAAGGAR